jgi:hypothetical protein
MSGLLASSAPAENYRCYRPGYGCPDVASCTGVYFNWSGTCSIRCWKYGDEPGEIVEQGTASCSSDPGGGCEPELCRLGFKPIEAAVADAETSLPAMTACNAAELWWSGN